MLGLLAAGETKYTVSKIAKENANGFAKVINTSPNVASKKLRRITKAILSKMDVGQEQKFPIPSSTARKSFVIKKTGYEEFMITVVIDRRRRKKVTSRR